MNKKIETSVLFLAIFVVVLTLTFLVGSLAGSTVIEGEPRNIRLRAQVLADTIQFDLRWVAPQRTSGQTPILGYDWEIWTSEVEANPFVNQLGGGSTVANNRNVIVNLPFECTAQAIFYTARVRATGNFSSMAPWGISGSIAIPCDNSPPGPPVINLDTIPRDTIGIPGPDSLVLMPIELPTGATWDRVTQRLGMASLGDITKMCAFAYRGNDMLLAPRASWVATMDSTVVITNSNVLAVTDANPLDFACWHIRAVSNGTTPLHLCTTDCPALQAFGLAIFPAWMKWPFLILGLFLIFFGSNVEKWIKNVRSS
jgi:hypothetical protein